MKYTILSILLGLAFTSYCSAESRIIETAYGSFTLVNKNTNTVLAAPHGTYDINTGSILSNVCFQIEVSCVIAKGFTPKGTRININRPTEGVGVKSTNEKRTTRANELYDTFKKAVLNVGKPNLDLYIEIHGSGIRGIEVALYNISVKEGKIIKGILREEWLKLSDRLIPIKVQGVDKIKMVGNAVKTFGIVADIQPKFIQFELSKKLRKQQSTISKYLANSITQIQNNVF